MDLEKLTPAPWYDDGYRIYGPTDKPDKRSGDTLVEYKHSDFATAADGALIALARNALDVMMRRGWFPIRVPAGWAACEQPDTQWAADPVNTFQWAGGHVTVAADPFTALVEADQWYKENVEQKKTEASPCGHSEQ